MTEPDSLPEISCRVRGVIEDRAIVDLYLDDKVWLTRVDVQLPVDTFRGDAAT
jgi:hypothetical protein